MPVTHQFTHQQATKSPYQHSVDTGLCGGMLVPRTGVEPVRGCPHRFLRPKRLPFRHPGTPIAYHGLGMQATQFFVEAFLAIEDRLYGIIGKALRKRF